MAASWLSRQKKKEREVRHASVVVAISKHTSYVPPSEAKAMQWTRTRRPVDGEPAIELNQQERERVRDQEHEQGKELERLQEQGKLQYCSVRNKRSSAVNFSFAAEETESCSLADDYVTLEEAEAAARREEINRRKSLSTMIFADLPSEEGNPGPLNDFVERRRLLALRAQQLRRAGALHPGAREAVVARLDGQVVNQIYGESESDEDELIENARDVIGNETLRGVLFDQIVDVQKNIPASAGGWPKTAASRLRDWASTYSQHRISVNKMHRDVKGSLIRFKLLNRRVHEPREISSFHRRKILNFWLEYNETSWDMDLQSKSKALGAKVFESTLVPSKQLVSATSPMARSNSLGSLLSATSPELRIGAPGGVAGVSLSKKLLPPIDQPMQRRYLRQCQSQGRMPVPFPFLIGQSSQLDLSGQDLTDPDILAIAESLMEVGAAGVQVVDLSGNAMISDKALAHFMARLMAPRVLNTLHHLNFRGCIRAGARCFDNMVHLVSDAYHLRSLDLSGVYIPLKQQLPLCEAVSQRSYLERVNLCDTGLGNGTSSHASQCIKTLLKGHTRDLDIAWNSFESDVFTCLGECMASNDKLEKLNLSHTGSVESEMHGAAISFFTEQLWKAKPLQELDLSGNRMDFRAALVLEDALRYHKTLRKINLSENPLGTLGLRYMLRALTYDTNELFYFDSMGCYAGEEPNNEDDQVFRAQNLQGTYTLNLQSPYHRSVLRMLCKSTEPYKLHPKEVIQVLSPADTFSLGSKNADGIWEVPGTDEVVLSYSLDRCLESSVFKDVPPQGLRAMLERFAETSRHKPAAQKLVQLFARWRELDGCHAEQTVLLKALSKDFHFTITEVEIFATTSALFKANCIMQLLPSIPQDDSSYFLTQMNFNTVLECLNSRKHIRCLLNFNAASPTGHYKLSLEKSSDSAVAEQLVLLDRWETLIDLRLGRADTSALCNRSHARNEVYQGNTLTTITSSFADWQVPEFDELELDYVSTSVAPKGARIMDSDHFERFLKAVHEDSSREDSKLEVLASLAHYIYLDSKQMRMLLGFFETADSRNNLFITFFNRLAELHDAKLYKVRYEDFNDLHTVYQRIGLARSFPYIQPEFSYFELDLTSYEHRMCVSHLVALAVREKMGNLRNPEYIRADGTMDSLSMGVPRSWESLDRVPTGGFFSCTYVCAPGDRNFAFRKQLCQSYAYVDVPVAEEGVNWITGLQEAPADIITFLMFLSASDISLDKAFTRIDGPEGAGMITLQKFQFGLQAMKFDKFEGPDEQDRVNALFRYLDPGGEGNISRSQWEVLHQLWKEVHMSISEFVDFLVRTFGPNLQFAWEAIDSNGDGEISTEEWNEAVCSLGYFGPSAVVYKLMDDDGGGSISYEEWKKLEVYVFQSGRRSTRRGGRRSSIM